MPRTKEQYEKIREDRKKLIMDAGLELFSREGFGHVSISSLANHAGISKGLMYNYFPGKEALLQAILNEGIEEIMRSIDPNHDGVLTRDEFILFIQKTFRMMHEERDYWVKLFSLIIQPNVKEYLKESAIVQFMEKYFGMFRQYFEMLGYEDPLLEVFHLSVIIEGFGIMMLYYNDLAKFPEDLFIHYEKKIIQLYT